MFSLKTLPKSHNVSRPTTLYVPCFRCYNANNGLSYCWCSTKDLCNGATAVRTSRGVVTVVAAVVAIVSAWWGAT